MGELEHGLGEALGEAQHRPPISFAYLCQCDAEHYAERYDLENLSVGNRLRDVLWKDMEDGLAGGEFLRLDTFGAGWGKFCAHSCFADVYGDPADDQRERRNHLEIDDRFHAHAADFLQI